MSLREGGTPEILQGGCRQRTYAWNYRRDTVVWKPDKSSPALAFSCFRGRFHSVSRFNDDLLREIFTREVFSLLLRKQLINLSLVQENIAVAFF